MGFVMLLPMLLGVLFWVAILGGGGYLLLRVVRALEARSGGGASGALADRVRTLEDALLRMEGQVEELAEAQRFTTRLLTERAGAPPDAPPNVSPNASPSAAADTKPSGATPPAPPEATAP